MASVRVLIVDNDVWSQRMVSSAVEQLGHTAEVVGDGWEGLERVSERNFDLVITAARLPTTNGWRLMQLVRSKPLNEKVPGVFLMGFQDGRKPGPGFRPETDKIVLKPFRIQQLEKLLRILLPGSAQPADTASSPQTFPFRRRAQ